MDKNFRLISLCLLAAVVIRGSSSTLSSESGSPVFFYQDQIYPRDCEEVQDQCSTRNATGTHLILPVGRSEPFWVSCVDEWTVIQRRLSGALDFRRTWAQYRDGFGYLGAEHWLGNEKLAQLTNQKTYEILIEFETKSGGKLSLSYDRFRISDEFSEYRLDLLGQQNGTADFEFHTNMTGRPPIRRDCYSVLREGIEDSGNYNITPSGWTGEPFTVNCNMSIDGGGWTVIQRRFRQSSHLDFNREWREYQHGFGDPSGEHWIGNEKLFYLTNQNDYELRIDMVQYYSNRDTYVKYDFFRINGELDEYRLSGLGNHTGTDFDALRFHHNMQFSAHGRDNDLHPTSDCAADNEAGWWYYQCGHWGNLNQKGSKGYYVGDWYTYHNNRAGSYQLRLYSEMKIRPKKKDV